MRFIPTRIHGVMDYLGGLLLIAAPWLFGFAAGGAETWVPVALGAGMIAAALMTDYEAGLVRMIPMKMHLGTDALMGLFLAASPWLFQFADHVWIPHMILGLMEIGGAATTETRSTRASLFKTGHMLPR